jgi:hypothetical protein
MKLEECYTNGTSWHITGDCSSSQTPLHDAGSASTGLPPTAYCTIRRGYIHGYSIRPNGSIHSHIVHDVYMQGWVEHTILSSCRSSRGCVSMRLAVLRSLRRLIYSVLERKTDTAIRQGYSGGTTRCSRGTPLYCCILSSRAGGSFENHQFRLHHRCRGRPGIHVGLKDIIQEYCCLVDSVARRSA